MHALVGKDKKWIWEDKQSNAFKTLKEMFTQSPLLVPADSNKRFRVESDASDYATGGVLSMLCDDEKWRPVAYLSKLLNETERNYDVHDKEMLGIMRCLEAWRHYLEGAKEQFEIWTDHKNLEYFMNAKKLNRRQARWALYLSCFNFTLIHKAGTTMGKADSLSRRPDHKKGMEDDNKDVTLLKPEFFKIRAIERGHVLINAEEKDLLKRIREAKGQDEEVIKAVEAMKRAKVRSYSGHEWSEEQGLVLHRGKVYVPKDHQLRLDITKLHHDSPIAGHGGQWKTIELVTRNYWWPGMTVFIKKYVDGCDKCQRNKSKPEPPAGKLMPNSAPEKPWTHISVDFIVKLPEAQGYNAILVVCNRMSKMIHVIPTMEETSAQGLAALYRDNVWKLHGLPESIISDRGPQFAAQLTRELNAMLGIKLDLSTAFHPQTDGQTE